MNEETFKKIIYELFKNHWNHWRDSNFWQIEASPFLADHGIHYELFENRVELHIESHYWRPLRDLFRKHGNELKQRGVCSRNWWSRNNCAFYLNDTTISQDEQLRLLKNALNPIIDEYIEEKGLRPKHIERKAPENKMLDNIGQANEKVVLYDDVPLEELFNNTLRIPDYQRIYCWRKKNVLELLHDTLLTRNDNDVCHLGSIILHKHDDGFDIVDGQQRLVTLTLLLEASEYSGCLPLINQCFQSEEAKSYIAYNKLLCRNFISLHFAETDELNKRLLNNLRFTVLIISEDSFELAYTFFSNENSRGKALNDFNLLKAHHLRYVDNERQQEHLAARWDNMTCKKDDKNTDVYYALGQHVLRLRKWMQAEIVPQTKYVIRDEYVAAPILEDVPGFGERFEFNESIQGGAYFFAYSEAMAERYHDFAATEEHKALIEYLGGESHFRYSELIDTLLFGYYLKFGCQYLAEALFAIEQTVSRHRYANKRAMKNKIMEFVANSHIIMMINRATSPTFFIAQLMQNDEITQDKDGIRQRYFNCVVKMYKHLKAKSKFSIKSLSYRINNPTTDERI